MKSYNKTSNKSFLEMFSENIEKLGNFTRTLSVIKLRSNSKTLIKDFFAVLIIAMVVSSNFFMLPVSAGVGASASVDLSLSKSIVNIGKSFTVTFTVTPNKNSNITSFNGIIKFDSSKLTVAKSGANPLVIRPKSVPSTYDIGASFASANEIDFQAYDKSDLMNKPIVAGNTTQLVTFQFTVKDTATVGSKLTFQIIDPSLTVDLEQVTPTITSAKTVTIGPKLETNAFLSSLSIEGAVISPKFDKNVMNYKASVPKEVISVKVTTQKESSKATVTVTGTTSLDYGDNTVTVTVTAQDTDVARRYKITVTRAFPETTPTEVISSQEESSDTISVEPTITEIIATPTVEATPEPTPIAPSYDRQLNFWKILTVVFAGLFVITLCILIWVAIDRNSMIDRDIKIRRL
jgi:hypothetical protein